MFCKLPTIKWQQSHTHTFTYTNTNNNKIFSFGKLSMLFSLTFTKLADEVKYIYGIVFFFFFFFFFIYSTLIIFTLLTEIIINPNRIQTNTKIVIR
jgi:hypothetical protein